MAFLPTFVLLSSLMIIAKCEVLSYNAAMAVHAPFEVACTDTEIRIYFNKTTLDARTDANNDRPWNIGFYDQVGNHMCNVDTNNASNINANGVSGFSDFVWIEAGLPDGCGVNEFEDNENIIYNQTIVVTYGSNPNSLIRREEYDYYMVHCLRNRTNTEQLVEYFNTTFRESGSDAKNNTADFQFTLIHTDNADLAETEYKLGEKIKFKLTMDTALLTVKSVIQTCWSTSDGSQNAYKLYDQRCPSDVGTSRDGNPTNRETKFITEAYRYLGASTSSIYVECLIRVCLATTSTQECTQCSNRKRRDVDGDGTVDSENTRLEVVRSPIFYIVETPGQPAVNNNSEQKSDSFLAGTNGTIVIVLLSLLVFITALAVIKKMFFSASTVQVPGVSMKGIENKGMA